MDQTGFLEYAEQIAAFPQNKWVLDLFRLTTKMGLHPAPVNGTPPELILLNLPEECEKPLLEYTTNNGLLIHIHEQGRMMYSGYFDYMMYGKTLDVSTYNGLHTGDNATIRTGYGCELLYGGKAFYEV